jgi:hypothetical protein
VTLKDIAEHGGRLDPEYYVRNKVGRPLAPPEKPS